MHSLYSTELLIISPLPNDFMNIIFIYCIYSCRILNANRMSTLYIYLNIQFGAVTGKLSKWNWFAIKHIYIFLLHTMKSYIYICICLFYLNSYSGYVMQCGIKQTFFRNINICLCSCLNYYFTHTHTICLNQYSMHALCHLPKQNTILETNSNRYI